MKGVVLIALVLILFVGCRSWEPIVGIEDIEYAQCDTISIKTLDGVTTCTVRCVVQSGNETLFYINCDE